MELRTVPPGTSVALYGLSANPPTGQGGHATIVSHLRDRFDEVWVLPVYRHIFDSKANNLAPYEHRKKMCELAFFGAAGGGEASTGTGAGAARGKVLVLDVEREVVTAAHERARREEEEEEEGRGGGGGENAPASSSSSSAPPVAVKVGSWDVLQALRGVNPGVEFTWCLGADTYADLRG